MVDRERLARLLDRVSDDVRMLQDLGERSDSPLPDATTLNAIKYLFITAIEGCARVAQHIIASETWMVADSNADAMRRLATEGVLTDATGQSLARAVGFRNILVHQYADVDDNQVLANLDRLEELRRFVGQVATWIDQT